MEFVRRTPSSEAPAGDSSDSLAPRAAAPHELVMQWFAQIWQHLPQFFDVQPEQDRWDSAAAEEYAAEDNGRGHPSAAAPPSAPSLTTPSPEVAEGASRQLMRRLSRVAMNKNEAESSAGKAAGRSPRSGTRFLPFSTQPLRSGEARGTRNFAPVCKCKIKFKLF